MRVLSLVVDARGACASRRLSIVQCVVCGPSCGQRAVVVGPVRSEELYLHQGAERCVELHVYPRFLCTALDSVPTQIYTFICHTPHTAFVASPLRSHTSSRVTDTRRTGEAGAYAHAAPRRTCPIGLGVARRGACPMHARRAHCPLATIRALPSSITPCTHTHTLVGRRTPVTPQLTFGCTHTHGRSYTACLVAHSTPGARWLTP